jgi:ribosomal protein S18 acetylase RimI-like enzyme
MRIRPFEPSEQRAVIALWERCGLLRPWNDPARDIQRKLLVQPELFLVGSNGSGELIASAMAGYDGHRAAVYYLAVDPAHQSRGAGRALMAEVERRLVAMGCPKINILIRTSNVAVRGFYDALGYKADDVACMGKRLIADD